VVTPQQGSLACAALPCRANDASCWLVSPKQVRRQALWRVSSAAQPRSSVVGLGQLAQQRWSAPSMRRVALPEHRRHTRGLLGARHEVRRARQGRPVVRRGKLAPEQRAVAGAQRREARQQRGRWAAHAARVPAAGRRACVGRPRRRARPGPRGPGVGGRRSARLRPCRPRRLSAPIVPRPANLARSHKTRPCSLPADELCLRHGTARVWHMSRAGPSPVMNRLDCTAPPVIVPHACSSAQPLPATCESTPAAGPAAAAAVVLPRRPGVVRQPGGNSPAASAPAAPGAARR